MFCSVVFCIVLFVVLGSKIDLVFMAKVECSGGSHERPSCGG